jgi:hypothetical protein
MNLTRILASTAVVVALTFGAAPAHAAQRSGGRSAGGAVRGGAVVRGSVGGRVATGGIGPRGFVGSGFYRSYYRSYYRPYYAFRPRFSLGFGLWAGYPIGYPYYYGYYGYGYPYYPYYAYGYPYPYPAPYAYSPNGYPADGSPTASRSYGYPEQPATGSVGVQPGQQAVSGGVSFEITPSTAAVFVDGTYVGTVANFGPTSQPLGLTTGRHRIEIRAPGHRTMAFDADVTPGQVIPYQGTLQESK